MYKKINKMESHHQILFSILIACGVIAFWRGIWGLMDLYLFPNNNLLSIITSLVLGLSILVATNYTVKELM